MGLNFKFITIPVNMKSSFQAVLFNSLLFFANSARKIYWLNISTNLVSVMFEVKMRRNFSRSFNIEAKSNYNFTLSKC